MIVKFDRAKSDRRNLKPLKKYVINVSSCGFKKDFLNVGKNPRASIRVINTTESNGL